MMKKKNQYAIWGYGREGKSALAYMQTEDPESIITIIDKQDPDTSLPKGILFMHEEEAKAKIEAGFFSKIVKSPGVSLYRPDIQLAQDNGTHITSGTNLWFKANPDICVIAVTGTKGKSTTAALIHHMLGKCGISSILAGNFGTPLIDVEARQDQVVVAELSSFQIADLHYYPEIAVLTNLYEAHLDWHGDRVRYHHDKMRLFASSEQTTAIIHKDDNVALSLLGDRENILFYGSHIGDLNIPEILNKPHNIRNISAALTAIETMNALSNLPIDALKDFQPLPHRQEIVGHKDGITFINDSISTVPETTVAALDAFHDKPVALIIGGQEKGQNYSCVYDAIKKYGNVTVFCIPDSGVRLTEECTDSSLCSDLTQAVIKSKEAVCTGGYILLSPGTPSFPIYRNYVERGEHFRKLCGF